MPRITFREIYAVYKKYKDNKENSYYPDASHKSNIRMAYELGKWYLNYKEVNTQYFLYGFDCRYPKRNQDSYINQAGFKKLRDRGNRVGSPDSWVPLLRDKLLFYRYMKMNHMPVPEVFAAMVDRHLVDSNLNDVPEEALENRKDYFLKAIDGQCGTGIEHISDYSMYKTYLDRTENRNYILQERVLQHDEMNRLNPEAVNTIRMITIMKDGSPVFYKALLRVGTKSSKKCDNTSQGGVGVGIDSDGRLMEYGFRKPQYGGRTRIHPDTGIVFEEFRIPYYREAIEMALAAHRLFYRIKSIGWDIAITSEGPVFIEGNDNWELPTFQAIYGGQKKILKELL